MRRTWASCLLLTTLPSLRLGANEDPPRYELGFDGPARLAGTLGQKVQQAYTCTLTTLGEAKGARGWSIAFRAQGARITSITTDGTAVSQYSKDGFQSSGLSRGHHGSAGAYSTVILSTSDPEVTLPPDSTQPIAIFELEAVVPEACDTVTLRYGDGWHANVPFWSSNLVLEGHHPRPAIRKSLRIELVNKKAPCAGEPEPGDIPAGRWNFLLPLTNRYGCDGGGAENMLRNWVAPFDLGTEEPTAGTRWKIDFDIAASSGFEAGNLFERLGMGAEPIWTSLEWLAQVTKESFGPADLCHPPESLSCPVVDLKSIVDRLNVVAGGLGIARIATDQVLGIAQTYVLNRSADTVCVDVCLASHDAALVQLNGQIVVSSSRCGELSDDCEELVRAQLAPGLNSLIVLSWQGDGEWGFRIALVDPETGKKITGEGDSPIQLIGTDPGDSVRLHDDFEVRRELENDTCCPVASPVLVVLRGRGESSADVSVVETFEPGGSPVDVTEVSDGGVVTIEDGVPSIAWRVPAALLAGTGVSYRIAIPAGHTVRPTGLVNGCETVSGAQDIKGPWPHTGPLGVFDDSHDIGTAESLARGPGSLALDPGPNATPGDSDDTYMLRPSGSGIGDSGDSFHFAYRLIRGDFTAEVRILRRDFPSAGGRESRFGLMARRDCSPESKFSLVHAHLERPLGPGAEAPETGSVDYAFRQSHRLASPVGIVGYEFPDPDGDGPELRNQPSYFRLVRRGQVLTGYASFDGVSWKLVGSDTWYGIADDTRLLVGIAATNDPGAPEPGAISFSSFKIGGAREFQTFDNDTGAEGRTAYKESFDEMPDGSLPPELLPVCSGDCPSFTPKIVGGRLRLTEEGIQNLSTAVFLNTPLPVNSGTLIIEYTLYLSHSGVTQQPPLGDPNPGEGMTLTILGGRGTSRVGAPGGGLGYDGITRSFDAACPSLSVEADTWSEGFFNEGTGSPLNDGAWHLGINSGGTVHSVAINGRSLPDLFSPRGVRHRVVYTADGKVSVFILDDGSGGGGGVAPKDGASALLEHPVEPLDSQGDTTGVVGFTASTGQGTQTSEVDDVVVVVLECTDSPERAVLGPTPLLAHPGDLVEFDATGSSPGDGDSAEGLQYHWTTEGNGEIEGPADAPRASLRLSSIIGDGEAIMRVKVEDGHCTAPSSAVATRRIQVTDKPTNFATYDGNGDGKLDLSDAVTHLVYLFGGKSDLGCLESMDFNGDSKLDISDPVGALTYLFLAGDPPARDPGCQFFTYCGLDGTCSN